MTCPSIPLKAKRRGALRTFIWSVLKKDEGTSVQTLYSKVLNEFGPQQCCPELKCGHKGKENEPEYCHIVRWVLNDGKADSVFANPERNNWILR